ncbi:MAG: hypothetical protein IPI60_20955 [Saprospiraceae bacterium]|nr:hypothetical protein [Saprospiraceae bacterium]
MCRYSSQLRSKTDIIEITRANLNDQSIEGFRMRNGQAFSVQYHPEAATVTTGCPCIYLTIFVTMTN